MQENCIIYTHSMSRQISTKHIINTIKIIYKAFENGNFSPTPKTIKPLTPAIKDIEVFTNSSFVIIKLIMNK